jgi:UDP-glucose 4-epimerase
LGTVAVMEAMRDAGVKRVVLTSSGAVYGEQEEQPVREDLPPNPGSPYAVSKLAAEHYVRTIGALWGIETVILRVFNAYGPGQPLPPSHAPVIPQLLKQALGGGSLVVFGDGRQSRDFVYVDDVVDGLAAAPPKMDRQVINIGAGSDVSIICQIRRRYRLKDPAHTAPKAVCSRPGRRAQRLLNFAPVALDRGRRDVTFIA